MNLFKVFVYYFIFYTNEMFSDRVAFIHKQYSAYTTCLAHSIQPRSRSLPSAGTAVDEAVDLPGRSMRRGRRLMRRRTRSLSTLNTSCGGCIYENSVIQIAFRSALYVPLYSPVQVNGELADRTCSTYIPP